MSLGTEDALMEAEKHAENAMDLFRFTGKKDAEVKAAMTLISCRMTTSGPDSALMLAKDTAVEYKTEKRTGHEAQAMHATAEIHMAKEEYEDALTVCKQAQNLFIQAGRKRGVAGVLNTIAGINVQKGSTTDAVKALSEVVNIFVELGDKRAEGGAHFAIADLLLGKLTEEVETETLGQYEKKEEKKDEKKELELKLTTDDV